MRRRGAPPFATAVAVLLLAACSSSAKPASAPTATTTTTTTPASGPAPRVVSFTGPRSPVLCTAPTSVELHWQTANATQVELRINGGDVFATYRGGAGDHLLPLTCNGQTQTYELTARAAGGRTATRTVRLAERVPVT